MANVLCYVLYFIMSLFKTYDKLIINHAYRLGSEALSNYYKAYHYETPPGGCKLIRCNSSLEENRTV